MQVMETTETDLEVTRGSLHCLSGPPSHMRLVWTVDCLSVLEPCSRSSIRGSFPAVASKTPLTATLNQLKRTIDEVSRRVQNPAAQVHNNAAARECLQNLHA